MARVWVVLHDQGNALEGPYVLPAQNVLSGKPPRTIIGNLLAADPSRWIYEETPAAPPTSYYQPLDPPFTYSFVGTPEDAGARVVEARQEERLSLDDLERTKQIEVRDQDDAVRYNALDTSLSANWWLILTEKQQGELLWVSVGANSREIAGQSWPSGPNAPWVGIFQANTTEARRYQITQQSTWDTLETEIALHLQATSNATDASRTALDALVAAAQSALDAAGGNESDPAYQAAWDDVAAHDAADPAWNYPPTIELPESVGTIFG